MADVLLLLSSGSARPDHSRAADQRQPVQLGAGASLRPAGGLRVLGGLGGPLRVQPGLPAAGLQRHAVPGGTGGPGAVERLHAHVHR